ncbi:MAG TPA: hypothetical protein ENI82_01500 [Bacteroidetes bacterium]|nr:hypothetical protein [Bacteroidota bacterium]
MKKLYLLQVILFISLNFASAQYVNGFHIKDLPTNYIEIELKKIPLTLKYKLKIDYGQKKDNRIVKTKDGKTMYFNSKIHAINFLTDMNYEYIDSYIENIETRSYVYFILKNNNKKSTN